MEKTTKIHNKIINYCLFFEIYNYISVKEIVVHILKLSAKEDQNFRIFNFSDFK